MNANEDPPDLSALFAAIQQAHVAIRPHVPVTPLALSVALSGRLGSTVLLKSEHLQPTGSFKYRGATNRVRSLSDEQRQRGVITASTGNHGLAVAQAGMLAGVGVTVYVARSAAAAKRAAIAALGATLVVVEGPTIEAEVTARRDAAAQDKVFISPYNDAAIVAGQGTAGMELAEQAPDLDAVFVAVGGGGLIGGIGTALRRIAPKAEIVGVWPENTPHAALAGSGSSLIRDLRRFRGKRVRWSGSSRRAVVSIDSEVSERRAAGAGGRGGGAGGAGGARAGAGSSGGERAAGPGETRRRGRERERRAEPRRGVWGDRPPLRSLEPAVRRYAGLPTPDGTAGAWAGIDRPALRVVSIGRDRAAGAAAARPRGGRARRGRREGVGGDLAALSRSTDSRGDVRRPARVV